MSQVAAPSARPASDRTSGEVGPLAVLLVSASVFAMLLVILAYAAHHGNHYDEKAMAAQGQRLVEQGRADEATVVRVGGAAGAPARDQ